MARLRNEIARLQKTIEQLSGQRSGQGPKGDRGPPGPQGPKGDVAVTDYDELVKNLPATTVQIIDSNGRIKQQASFKIGGRLRLQLVPVNR